MSKSTLQEALHQQQTCRTRRTNSAPELERGRIDHRHAILPEPYSGCTLLPAFTKVCALSCALRVEAALCGCQPAQAYTLWAGYGKSLENPGQTSAAVRPYYLPETPPRSYYAWLRMRILWFREFFSTAEARGQTPYRRPTPSRRHRRCSSWQL